MTDATATTSAATRTGRPRKWGNRRPVAKRLDLPVEEALRLEIEREEKRFNRFVSVRLTRAEKETLKERADAYGMSLSDFARTVMLSGLKEPPPPRTDPAALRLLAFELSKVGTNLNQLAKRANEAHQISADKERRTLLEMESALTALTAQIAATLEKVMAL